MNSIYKVLTPYINSYGLMVMGVRYKVQWINIY